MWEAYQSPKKIRRSVNMPHEALCNTPKVQLYRALHIYFGDHGRSCKDDAAPTDKQPCAASQSPANQPLVLHTLRKEFLSDSSHHTVVYCLYLRDHKSVVCD